LYPKAQLGKPLKQMQINDKTEEKMVAGLDRDSPEKTTIHHKHILLFLA